MARKNARGKGVTMTLKEFQNQVLSLGIFSIENTAFQQYNDNTFEARLFNGTAGVIFENGKYQVLINGSNVHDPKLMHKDIRRALILAERRAHCFQIVNWRQVDTYDENTFNYSV